MSEKERKLRRTEAEALAEFHKTLNHLVSCLSKDVFTKFPVSKGAGAHDFTVSDAKGIKLKHAEFDLTLTSVIRTETVKEDARFRISTNEYIHHLKKDGEPVIGWHFHPGDAKILFPHIHLYTHEAKDSWWKGMNSLHMPSGRILLEDVIWFLVSEIGVEPARNDWIEVIKKHMIAFQSDRSWGQKPPVMFRESFDSEQ